MSPNISLDSTAGGLELSDMERTSRCLVTSVNELNPIAVSGGSVWREENKERIVGVERSLVDSPHVNQFLIFHVNKVEKQLPIFRTVVSSSDETVLSFPRKFANRAVHARDSSTETRVRLNGAS